MPMIDMPSDRREYFYSDNRITALPKDEDSVNDYTLDWSLDYRSNRLNSGETISTSTWECNGVTNEGDSNTTTTTTIQLSGTGGTAKNTIVTSAGRTLVFRLELFPIKS